MGSGRRVWRNGPRRAANSELWPMDGAGQGD